MQMKLAAVERIFRNLQLRRMTLDVTQSDPCRFTHNVAQLTREDQPSTAGHGGGFDKQHISAFASYGQTRSNARNSGAGSSLVMHFGSAQGLTDALHVDCNRRLTVLRRNPRCGLSKQSAELAFELSDSCLACVIGDDRSQHRIVDSHFFLPQTVLLDLARPE